MTPVRYALLAVGVVLVAAAFIVGRSLRPDAEVSFAYASDHPAYEAAPASIGRSTAGFSGAGVEGAFDGSVVVAGRVVANAGGTLELDTASGVRSTLRVSDSTRVAMITPGSRSNVVPGATVIARLDDTGAVQSILIVATP